MIENERQYHITKSALSKFQAALAEFDIGEATARIGSRVLAEAEAAALESEIDVLSGQISDYGASLFKQNDELRRRVAELETWGRDDD